MEVKKHRTFNPQAEKKIGQKFAKRLQRSIRTAASLHFRKSGSVKDFNALPRFDAQGELSHIIIKAPKHAFVRNFGVKKKTIRELVSQYSRSSKRKIKHSVRHYDRTRKMEMKSNPFISNQITPKLLNELAKEIAEQRSIKIVFNIYGY